MPYKTPGAEAIRAMITLRTRWFEREEIYLNPECLDCGTAATYLLYFTNREIQQLLLHFIGRYNCNPKLHFDFLDLHDFAMQYEILLSDLERLVIHYSFSQTQQSQQQCFETTDSIFARPYAALCHTI